MRRFGIWKDGKQVGEGVLWDDETVSWRGCGDWPTRVDSSRLYPDERKLTEEYFYFAGAKCEVRWLDEPNGKPELSTADAIEHL